MSNEQITQIKNQHILEHIRLSDDYYIHGNMSKQEFDLAHGANWALMDQEIERLIKNG